MADGRNTKIALEVGLPLLQRLAARISAWWKRRQERKAEPEK